MIKYPEKYPINEVLDIAKNYIGKSKKDSLISFHGDLIKMSSMRLTLFATKGITCVNCGLTGAYFLKCKGVENELRPHLNLYSNDGMLITLDHIIPKVLGGKNQLNNFQVMCDKCNFEKGDKFDLLNINNFLIQYHKGLYHLFNNRELIISDSNVAIVLMKLNNLLLI